MRRNAFDESRDQRIATECMADHMSCTGCGKATHRSVMAELGARCKDCYEAYCAAAFRPRQARPDTQAQRVMRRAIEAHALLDRAMSDKSIGSAQITAALRRSGDIAAPVQAEWLTT